MSIQFAPITRQNLWAVVRLDVHDEQRNFVAPNARSLAEAYVYTHWEPLAVVVDDAPVGFVMWGNDDESPERDNWIIRVMIDAAHQGKGYGRATVLKLIEHIAAKTGCDAVYLCVVPDNAAAQRLYESIGFVDTGRIEHGEMVYKYAIQF